MDGVWLLTLRTSLWASALLVTPRNAAEKLRMLEASWTAFLGQVCLIGVRPPFACRSSLFGRTPGRAQSTVEYGLTLLAVAGAGLALWLLLGPAIQQLGERLVTQVNGIK
jgi:hypothetical protein